MAKVKAKKDSWKRLGLDLAASAFKVSDPGFWTVGSISLDGLIRRARKLKEGK